jgi:hypothetical protein
MARLAVLTIIYRLIPSYLFGSEPSHWYTTLQRPDWWLVIVGTGATIAALLTLRAIRRQSYLMNRSMVSQFRPRLVVRQMCLDSEDSNPDAPKWAVRYAIFNTGGTRAVIKRIHVFVSYHAEPSLRSVGGKLVPANPDDHKQEIDALDEFILEAGQCRELAFDPGLERKIEYLVNNARNGVTNPELVGLISLRGEIEYFDEIGTRRIIGISRELDIPTKRFTISSDTDFEYAD